jgi:hypothetical protein
MVAVLPVQVDEYVKNGGTMIVQYVTPGGSFIQNGLKVNQIGPYPFTLAGSVLLRKMLK